MKTGITGHPFSGKTTLFCALTGQDYDSLAHGRDVHIGTVKVPDERLDRLNDMFLPKKKTYATMEYFDVAGHTGGREAAFESKSLLALKGADSLIIVLDAFNDDANPRRDFDTLMEEFAFNDLVVVTNRLERLVKEFKSGKRDDLAVEHEVLQRCREQLENGASIRDLEFDAAEEKALRGFQFLSQKPILIVVNIAENDIGSARAEELETKFSDVKMSQCTAICCEIEKEIAKLDDADRPEFLESLGISEPALGRVIRLSYRTLGLISFFTAGGTDEVRAWTVHDGSNAQKCAGAIHSDLERGFIRAETVAYEDLMKTGSFAKARDQGLLRIEGKDYIVKDGDILTIRFSV